MNMNTTKTRVNPGAVRSTAVFMPRPDRTIEWLGGVTYANLERVLADMKSFLAEDPVDDVHLLVSSYGGATGIGMSFYDAVNSWLKPNLTTIGSGDVDSSGVIIFLAGQKRYLTKNTTLLLHLAGRTFQEAKRFSTAEMATMLAEDKLKDFQYASVVASATNGKYTPQQILDLMAKNTILTPEEAINMGIAHKVLK